MSYLYLFFFILIIQPLSLLQGMEDETENTRKIGIQKSIELLTLFDSKDKDETEPQGIDERETIEYGESSSDSWFTSSSSKEEESEKKEREEIFWNNVIFQSKKDYSIQSTSFDEKGKKYLECSIKAMHEAAKYKNISTGLAAIYNKIPADIHGMDMLLYDDESLKYATQFNEFLKKETTYQDLIPTFCILERERFEGAGTLAQDLKRTCVQGLLYKKIITESDIRVPSDNLGAMFMGKGTEVDSIFLEYNKDIDVQKNTSQAQGWLLLMAYYMQK